MIIDTGHSLFFKPPSETKRFLTPSWLGTNMAKFTVNVREKSESLMLNYLKKIDTCNFYELQSKGT